MLDINTTEFATIVRDAWRAGRQIVPIIGAGASADVGVPTISALVKYLAGLRAFVDACHFLPKISESETNLQLKRIREFAVDRYKGDTATFIGEHGWIDRFDLSYELFRHASRDKDVKSAVDNATRDFANEMYPSASSKLRWVRSLLPDDLGEQTNAEIAKLEQNILLDWRPLVRHFTGHRQELIESLFQSIHRNRKPSVFHQYLAHLTSLLRIRILFTFNFDELIEQAFVAEEMLFQVFTMDYGHGLPSRPLLFPPSIIKLHGGNHNLLVDERVDYPLDDSYLASCTLGKLL